MFDFLKGVVASLIASIVFYYFIEIRRNMTKNKKSNYRQPNPAYIKSVKREFYICFFSIVFILAIYFGHRLNEFSGLGLFVGVLTFFLFLFTLFAFMCMEEAVKFFLKQEKDNYSSGTSRKKI